MSARALGLLEESDERVDANENADADANAAARSCHPAANRVRHGSSAASNLCALLRERDEMVALPENACASSDIHHPLAFAVYKRLRQDVTLAAEASAQADSLGVGGHRGPADTCRVFASGSSAH